MARLRPYAPDDLDALYRICLLTGDAGKDASALYRDPQLVGHIYAAPYGVLEPEHAFVVEDEGGVAGYIVGTHDSEAFSDRMERDWWPALRRRYAYATGLNAADRQRIGTIMRPERQPAQLTAPCPAHIHMNLLPHLRGRGIGSRLLGTWIEQARAAGVRGIHLGASATNAGGIAFWTRSGFTPALQTKGAVWFTMELGSRAGRTGSG